MSFRKFDAPYSGQSRSRGKVRYGGEVRSPPSLASESRDLGGLGGICEIGRAGQASLLEIDGRQTGIGAPAGLLSCTRSEVLGDQRFVEQIDERIRAEREIEIPHQGPDFQNWCI